MQKIYLSEASRLQDNYKPREWSDKDQLVTNLNGELYQQSRSKPARRKTRIARVVNIEIDDCRLVYTDYTFSKSNISRLNPRNPFQEFDSLLNYEEDSEAELDDLLGADCNSDEDSSDEDSYGSGNDSDSSYF